MSNSSCNAIKIDFIVKEGGSPNLISFGNHVRKNLEDVSSHVSLITRVLNETEYVSAELVGDFHLVVTNTWGAPYDPHSYMASWATPSSVEYRAIENLEPPLTREDLLTRIGIVQTKLDRQAIQSDWRSILEDIHEQAIFLPLWGARVPHVVNRRLIGYTPASQAWSFPMHTLQVVSGSATVTVSPGATYGGIFRSGGPINPHEYHPNQMWAQDWVYEGLLSYGRDGQILPALASSWTVEDTGEGTRVSFFLRQGVLFHDGTPWNCDAAVLNFDHALSDNTRMRHKWLGAAKYLKSWTCNSNLELVLETDTHFYPLLQELTYIRPLRFASPSAFANGLDSDPVTQNSCDAGGFGTKLHFLEKDVTCAGLSSAIGTGPFKYVERNTAEDGSDTKVVFERNDLYWGGAPAIETLVVVKYGSNEEVDAALKDGTLDMALGIGPLTPKQVSDIKLYHSDYLNVLYSDVAHHSILVFNSNKPPLDDISTRRAVIHAIDKVSFIEEEFLGLKQPVMQLLPKSAPFCNVDLSPEWRYDIDKAKLLNCSDNVLGPSPVSRPSSIIPTDQPAQKPLNQSTLEPSLPVLFSRSSSPTDQPISKLLNRSSSEPISQSSNHPSFAPSSQASDESSDILYSSESDIVSLHGLCSLLVLYIARRFFVY